MGRWKIELEPSSSPSPSGDAKGRFRVLRPGSMMPLLQLEEDEAKDLADGLVDILKRGGPVASEPADRGPRRVSVALAKQRVRIRTATRTVKLTVAEAAELLDALAHTLGRGLAGHGKPRQPVSLPRPTAGERPAAWQCSRCLATANASPQSPPVSGCAEGGHHEWMRGGLLRLVEAVQQSLPGHTVSIARDPREPGTSCRVEDAKGEPVGVAVVTDDYAASAPLDRIEARASEVARLLKVLRAYGDGAPSRYVEVNERGIRIRLR